jgi:hypothetical protein
MAKDTIERLATDAVPESTAHKCCNRFANPGLDGGGGLRRSAPRVGEYIAKGKPPVQTFEMNLARVGDTDWPLTTPVSPSVAEHSAR